MAEAGQPSRELTAASSFWRTVVSQGASLAAIARREQASAGFPISNAALLWQVLQSARLFLAAVTSGREQLLTAAERRPRAG